MILISITGGTKSQRKLTERAARYMIRELLPRKKNLVLDVSIQNIKEKAMGYCDYVERDTFELTVHNKCSLYEYVSTIAHELTHLKQYAKGELVTKIRKVYWKGEDMSDVPYSKQPWEKEANRVESDLAKKFIKEELELTIGLSKILSPRRSKWQPQDKDKII